MNSKYFVAIIFSLGIGLAHAVEPILVAYKDSEGKVTQQSRQQLNEMAQIARSEGTITVWVDFSISFVGDPAQRTPETKAQQAIDRQNAINAVLSSAKGNAYIVEADAPDHAANLPGALFEVNAQGLGEVMRHQIVKHIGYKPMDE